MTSAGVTTSSVPAYVVTLSPAGAVRSATALTLPAGLGFDEWLTLGRPLLDAGAGLLWWVGDWLVYADREWGSDSAGLARIRRAVADVTSLEVTTLSDAKYVAAAIPPERRRSVLSWSHHKTVAGLPPAVADDLLDAAAVNRWTRAQLRAEVRARTSIDASSTEQPRPVTRSARIVLDLGDSTEVEARAVVDEASAILRRRWPNVSLTVEV